MKSAEVQSGNVGSTLTLAANVVIQRRGVFASFALHMR